MRQGCGKSHYCHKNPKSLNSFFAGLSGGCWSDARERPHYGRKCQIFSINYVVTFSFFFLQRRSIVRGGLSSDVMDFFLNLHGFRGQRKRYDFWAISYWNGHSDKQGWGRGLGLGQPPRSLKLGPWGNMGTWVLSPTVFW